MSSLFIAKKINEPQIENNKKQDESTAIPVDVYRENEKLIILAPISGVSIEDISVSLTEDLLTIKGVRNKPEQIQDSEYFSQECFWGEFHRSIIVPVNVDVEKVAAFYKKGILRIEMPIMEEDITRVIPVRIENG